MGLQATSAKHYGEKDARLEYLSWRVWFMKRNRALAKEERRKRDALLAEEGTPTPVHDEETSHDGETSDEETLMPVTSTGSKGVSFELEKKASQHLGQRKPTLPRVSPLLCLSASEVQANPMSLLHPHETSLSSLLACLHGYGLCRSAKKVASGKSHEQPEGKPMAWMRHHASVVLQGEVMLGAKHQFLTPHPPLSI